MSTKIAKNLAVYALVLFMTGCAGGNPSPVSPTETVVQEKEDTDIVMFEPDSTPLPDLTHWIDEANNSEPVAEFVLHMMYRDNIGDVSHYVDGKKVETQLDASDMHKEMIRWQSKVDEHEFAYAGLVIEPSLFYEMGEETRFGDNEQKARDYLEETAKRGYANAEYILGMIYWNGLGVEKNTQKGYELIRRAADHGISNAQYDIAMMYEFGLYLKKDVNKSISWLEKAMAAENKDAAFILAMKYYDGIGVERNVEKARSILKNDLTYHPWNMLLYDNLGVFKNVCSFEYDNASILDMYDDGCRGDAGEEYDACNPNGDVDLESEEFVKCVENFFISKKAAASLKYKIDYNLARKWLEESANDVSHDYSRILLAQIYLSSGCKGGQKINDNKTFDKALNLLKSAYEHNISETTLGMAEIYHARMEVLSNGWDDDGNELSDEIKKQNGEKKHEFAQLAFDYYQKAAELNLRKAYGELARIYDGTDMPSISEELNISQDRKKSYEYGLNAGNTVESIYNAGQIADDYHENGNDKEALVWYQKAIDAYMNEFKDTGGENGETKRWYMKMAFIYDKSKDKSIHDMKKAMEYYDKIIANNGYKEMYMSDLIQLGLRLGNIYKSGKEHVKKNPKLALEWYKRAIEADKYTGENNKEISTAIQYFQSQPKADLKNAVEFQIKQEYGKNPKEFVVIKSAYKPCAASPESCSAKIYNLYHESVDRAINAITAFSLLNNEKVDLQYINNTLYELAIIYGKNGEYRKSLAGYSPAYQMIYSDNNIKYNDKIELFYIWYLRQIPYAVAEEFKKYNSDKSWDDYTKEAKSLVKKTPELKNAFNYDFLTPIQSFPKDLMK